MEVNPLSIILVKSDSKGDRLLFRYPYHHATRRHDTHHHHNGHHHHHHAHHPPHRHPAHQPAPHQAARRRNPYALAGGTAAEDILQSPPPQTSNIEDGQLCGFTDEVLSTLFAVKPELCNRKFELKVNDVRFVAHPTLMQSNQHAATTTTTTAQQQQQQQQQPTAAKDAMDGATTSAAAAAAAAAATTAVLAGNKETAPGAAAISANCTIASNTATTSVSGTIVVSSQSSPSKAHIASQPLLLLSSAAAAAANNVATSALASATSPATTATTPPVASQPAGSSILINIVFALHAQASYSIVKCYYELSKRLGHALVYEEKRVGYLTDEMRLMVKTHDEIAGGLVLGDNNGGDNGGGGGGGDMSGSAVGGLAGQGPGAFDLILERSTLAQCLRNIYHDLCTTGLLNITINQWVTLSFCLPQKAHQFHKRGVVVEPEAIDRCLQSLKPYHGMLLLVDLTELLDCFPPSGARMLLQLLHAYNPLKTLQNMAAEADLDIKHVYELVGHLVYWAKATIIYPLCETNVYVIAPDAPLHTQSPLVDKFAAKFPGMSLFEVISDFSLPTSIGHLTTPLQHPTRQGTLAQMVLWMLQHHLLMQLHTYVQFMPTEHGECSSSTASEEADDDGGAAEANDGLAAHGGDGGLEAINNATGAAKTTDNNGVEENEKRYNERDAFEEDNEDDDGMAPLSQLSISSRQMIVAPNTSRRSITEDASIISDTYEDADDDDADEEEVTDCDHLQSASATFSPSSQSSSTSHSGDDESATATTTDNEDDHDDDDDDDADSLAGSAEDEDKIRELLLAFREPERSAVRELSAASNAEDLALMVKLWQAGYFKGEHHLEEIMYFENLRRSQLLQLLDKFRDVLIIYETEDPAIATLYTQTVD